MAAELQLCIPFAEGAKIKAEIKCKDEDWQEFEKNAALRATVRLLSESEKAKESEAG